MFFIRNRSELPIPIAANRHEALELNRELLSGEIPGFQMTEEVFSENGVINRLAIETGTIVPDFGFNDTTDSMETMFGPNWRLFPATVLQKGSIDTGLHFDTSFQGIAVHVNEGPGTVMLQATNPRRFVSTLRLLVENGEPTLRQGGTKHEIDYAAAGIGPKFIGKLSTETTVTVFAEDMLLHGGRSAALHHFSTKPGAHRHWRRYGYLPPSARRIKKSLPYNT